jgi:hypothetical protein
MLFAVVVNREEEESGRLRAREPCEQEPDDISAQLLLGSCQRSHSSSSQETVGV